MPVRDFTAAATAALLLALAPLASVHAQAAKDSTQADARFIRKSLQDNALEVRMGEVAQHQASNQMVQKLGERMVTDHGRLQKQWADLATKHGVTVSDSLGAKDQQRLAKLQGLPKSSFDKQYVTAMLHAHAKDARELKSEVDSAQSDPVKKMAAYELPIVQEHLLAVAAAAKEVGVDSTVVNRSKSMAEGKTTK
jgi:putative membrane protein